MPPKISRPLGSATTNRIFKNILLSILVDLFYKILIPATVGFMTIFVLADAGSSMWHRLQARRSRPNEAAFVDDDPDQPDSAETPAETSQATEGGPDDNAA